MLLLTFVALASAFFLVAEVATLPARERQALLRRAARYGRSRPILHGLEETSFRKRALSPLKRKTANAVLRIQPRISMEEVQLRLQSAGMRDVSPEAMLATRGLAGGAGLLFGLVIGVSSGGIWVVVWPLMLGGIGYILPSYLVTLRARRRCEEAVAQLPDALDLLAISVEAGLGFDGAITKLTEHMEGPLIEEFELCLGEIRVGSTRAGALKKMAARLDTPEIGAFVRSLVQADQLGISLGRILRVQAADTRLKRQAAAEERAAKAPIKMLFPTVAFIFPGMFIVILGPAMIQISKVLGI
ncbi:MAG: type II secretion system F family protein [Gaiellaceae bacterium]